MFIKYSELEEKAKNSLDLSLIVDEKIISAKIAISTEEKEKGLAGIEDLPQLQGMLFCYEKPTIANFWMKGVIMPRLGILFLNNKGEVVGKETMTSENPTLICSSQKPINYALELNPEIIEDIRLGDMVKRF